jgi:hypothetical protein
MVGAIMRDFHARIANFIQNANLRHAVQQWQNKFDMALDIPPTSDIPGFPDSAKLSMIESFLEDLRERYSLLHHHATMTDKASQSVEVSDTSCYAVQADGPSLQSSPSLCRKKSRREPQRRRMRIIWYGNGLV